ncbi:MAG TPA: FAD-dependent oxidoreductase [Chitinophagaceae bacterium]|nr:FAD-dependent oxidoreductase [Chitinophagaceae bacterium]
MDLRSHSPYSLLKNGIIRSYPSISSNENTDVAIMGAGITGALTGWHLAKSGFSVVVLDRRHAGMGSTAASTSILQYELDVPLLKLQEFVGRKNAEKSYSLCLEAIDDLESIAGLLKMSEDFERSPSLQLASFKKDVEQLKKECVARKNIGIDVDFLDEKALREKFQVDRPGGLISSKAAQVDAYKLTHALLKDIERMGGKVYDHSSVTKIIHHKESVQLKLDGNFNVNAKKLVIACGYESLNYLPKKIEELSSTYVILSEPFSEQEFWYQNSLIWETAVPYMYLKITTDNRILVGGRDSAFQNPSKRDALLNTKALQLEKDFRKLFPHIPFKTDFKWAGTFSSSKDGLPYIGSIPERANTYFALGYGGNGITFSLIGAQIINDIMHGKKRKDDNLFDFQRLSRRRRVA